MTILVALNILYNVKAKHVIDYMISRFFYKKWYFKTLEKYLIEPVSLKYDDLFETKKIIF